MEKLKNFRIEGDVPAALMALKPIATHKGLIREIEYISSFSKMASATAEVRLFHLSSNGDRKKRRITQEAVAKMKQAVMHIDDMKLRKKPSADMFHGTDRTDSLGEILDVSTSADTIEQASSVIDELCLDWKTDCVDLAKLIKSYVVAVPLLLHDHRLQPENKELLTKLTTSPHFENCGKATGLLASWNALLKDLCLVGMSKHVTPVFLKDMQASIQEGSDTVDWMSCARQIMIEIPKIPNRVARVKAAKQFREQKVKHMNIGKGFGARLDILIDGEVPENAAEASSSSTVASVAA